MKKLYMKPDTTWTVVDDEIILAGSGPNPGDQTDPTLSREDDDLWGTNDNLLETTMN